MQLLSDRSTCSSQFFREKELYHGLVLARFSRNYQPIQRVARLNVLSDVYSSGPTLLYIKHSTSPRMLRRDRGLAWYFSFSSSEIKGIGDLLQAEQDLNLVLVCGEKSIENIGNMNACAIYNEEIRDFLVIGMLHRPQTIKVAYYPNTGKSLRVLGSLVGYEHVIPRSRLDNWDAPAD